MFRIGSVSIGSVNFPLEVDGKVHRLASEFPKLLGEDNLFAKKRLSFGEAALRAAQVNYPRPKGDRIHFWGPAIIPDQRAIAFIFGGLRVHLSKYPFGTYSTRKTGTPICKRERCSKTRLC